MNNDVIFHFHWHYQKLCFGFLIYAPIIWHNQSSSLFKAMVDQILTFNCIWILKVLRWRKLSTERQAALNVNAHGLSYFSIFTTSSDALWVRLVPCEKFLIIFNDPVTVSKFNCITDFTLTDFKIFLLLNMKWQLWVTQALF